MHTWSRVYIVYFNQLVVAWSENKPQFPGAIKWHLGCFALQILSYRARMWRNVFTTKAYNDYYSTANLTTQRGH